MPQVVVDGNLCTGCGICAKVCPVTVFDINDRRAVATRVATCMACELCVTECPWRAITVNRLATAGTSAVPAAPAAMQSSAHSVSAAAPLPAHPSASMIPPAAAARWSKSASSPGVIVPQIEPMPSPMPTCPAVASAVTPGQQPDSAQKRDKNPSHDLPSASPFLSAPDFFPYFVVKKGPPESSNE